MGVDLGTWCEVMAKHPLKYKFEGLYPCKSTVVEAASNDSAFAERWHWDQWESEHDVVQAIVRRAAGVTDEPYDIGMAHEYSHFLLRLVSVFEWVQADGVPDPERVKDEETEPEEDLMVINSFSDETRAMKFVDLVVEFDRGTFEAGLDEETLLEDYPPIGVVQNATDEVILFKDIVLICPMCGLEPITDDMLDGGSFYCGLCGGSCSCETLDDLTSKIGAKLYPFVEVKDDAQPGPSA